MIEVIGVKRVQTANSEYLLTLIRVGGKLKCVCRKTADLSLGERSVYPVGWKCEVASLELVVGKKLQLGTIFTSRVLRIENVK